MVWECASTLSTLTQLASTFLALAGGAVRGRAAEGKAWATGGIRSSVELGNKDSIRQSTKSPCRCRPPTQDGSP